MHAENSCSRRELVKVFGAGLAGAALVDSLPVAEAQPTGDSRPEWPNINRLQIVFSLGSSNCGQQRDCRHMKH